MQKKEEITKRNWKEKKEMDFDEDDLGNSQDSQQFRQGYQSQVLSNHPNGNFRN